MIHDDLDLISEALSLWAKRAETDLASPSGQASTPEARKIYARRMERAAYLAGLCASKRCEDAAMLLAALKPDLAARGTLPLVVLTRDDVIDVLGDVGDDEQVPGGRLTNEQADEVLDALDRFDFEWAEWVRDAHGLL